MIYGETGVPLDCLRSDHTVRAVKAANGPILADHLALCLTSLTRLRGLLGRPPLEPGEGMLLLPCRGVHTLFMGYPIDVAFLDPEGRIIALRPELRPWRATPVFAAALATLELPAGTLSRHGVARGDLLAFQQITG